MDYSQIELSKEVLDSFASAMVPEIKKFYESDFGKEYFKKWLEKHPEYA
ncbi:MAG: PTS system mannose/fructose/sorbose family transporter subunit IID [Ruminococcaceae bacterium]|nr:PTS system mannose/fructose/sorbose family transporter subunit IID [Oscillospiraceae bacterium]